MPRLGKSLGAVRGAAQVEAALGQAGAFRGAGQRLMYTLRCSCSTLRAAALKCLTALRLEPLELLA